MFILVYRLAMDARTLEGDGGADRKYPSLLEDFLAAATSMARKRHLASTARGLFGFCLMARIVVQKVQGFQLRPIRILRARMMERHTCCSFTEQLDFYISIHFF